uniref:Axin n=1 Tax=Novocrania anomala TaxID=317945 RepID=A0A165USR3_9BILA|nr:axin [Novocrania anomala]
MSVGVHQFLSDSGGHKFTENAPRPPVPGEENELQSNGGHSTKSSGSHKSHVSNKSHSSGKSMASHRSDHTHSPAGTPRRSNLDKTGTTQGFNKEDVEAPLGFEPEGSAANSPPFTENSTPPCLNWAKNLRNLLADGDGVNLFRQFLVQEQCLHLLNFWFACQGLKNVYNSGKERDKIPSLEKLIYKKFIRGDSAIKLTPEIRSKIVDRVTKRQMDHTLFDQAQSEIEETLEKDSYRTFLKSDLYVQYIQTGGESPKESSSSSGSNSVRPISSCGPLPTLHEDAELETESIPMPLTSKALMATRWTRADNGVRKVNEASAGLYMQASHQGGRVPNPYHYSYAPVSAQDSELQSLSSDALTDTDTMSLTDSSVDGRPVYNKRRWKRQARAINRSAQQNRDTALTQHMIPRTAHAPKDRNIAETDPMKFAVLLAEKLEVVCRERERDERLQHQMKCISEAEESEDSSLISRPNTRATINSLMAAFALGGEVGADNDQSILEEHCSRIWDSSAGQTPSLSPGKHTPPRSKSPDRGHKRTIQPPAVPAGMPAVAYKQKVKRDKPADKASVVSYDSGVSEGKSYYVDPSQTKHILHVHHHHHSSRDKTRQQLEIEAQQRSMTPYMHTRGVESTSSGDPAVRGSRTRDGTSKRTGSKKGSDTASVSCDSGVSVLPDLQDPQNNKVMAWMLENEQIMHCASTNTDSERSSSHKRSHTSKSATASPLPHRTGAISKSKAPPHYNATRSGPLERSGISSMIPAHISQMQQGMPSQPVAQDPSMPLLAPPNPTTQLEEAKRRLQDESMARHTAKSRAFSSAVPKQKHSMSAMGPPRSTPPTRGPPGVAEMEDDYYRRQTRRPSSAPVASSIEETVVGYYFCDDPVPYKTSVQGRRVTLAQFKELLTKKGNYKYFFKKASNEFDIGVVHEEVTDDSAILPLWEGKIVGKVEKKE